ncbi:MAG: methionine gamma-lyase family protein [Clostridia bacterium]|nr:methionine gamma-lyase family protein [Clostridia bacterium]
MDELKIERLIDSCEKKLKNSFETIEKTALFNQEKVLDAFVENRIALRHFNGTTGYGYDDIGRDTLKKVYASVFHAQAAVITPHIVSGTHAISLALYALLRRGDRVLSVTGLPYDTLRGVISGGDTSLKACGVEFTYVGLKGKDFDHEKIRSFDLSDYAMIYVQRSRGYDSRAVVSIEKMRDLFADLRKNGYNGIIMVDNCYGEFVDINEPTDVGANVIAGSLIKNPGGGITPTGGYVAGDKELIDRVEARLTCPSIAAEVGSYAYGYQYYYQGLFIAPHVVSQALKGNMLFGACMAELGYITEPAAYELPNDATRSIILGDEDKLVKFIQAIQSASPVDSYLTLVPWDMPGYDNKVVMASGSFVQGSSIELSADAPIKPPYTAFLQGGLTYEHCKIALKRVLKNL